MQMLDFMISKAYFNYRFYPPPPKKIVYYYRDNIVFFFYFLYKWPFQLRLGISLDVLV